MFFSNLTAGSYVGKCEIIFGCADWMITGSNPSLPLLSFFAINTIIFDQKCNNTLPYITTRNQKNTQEITTVDSTPE